MTKKCFKPDILEIENRLNQGLNYMELTALANGVQLNNIYVNVCSANGKYQVTLGGDVNFAPRKNSLSKNICINAVLYDKKGTFCADRNNRCRLSWGNRSNGI